MSVSPVLKCLPVPQLRNVFQSGNTKMYISLQLYNVHQSCDWNVYQPCLSVNPATLKIVSVLQLSNILTFLQFWYLSVLQLWNVQISRNSEKSTSRSNQKFPQDLQFWNVLQLWNVSQSRNSEMFVSPATLKCPSFQKFLSVCQSCNYGMSVSPATS